MFGYKLPAAPGSVLVPTKYRFKKPAKLHIRRPNGMVILEGFGVGETIAILEPSLQYLTPARERLDEVPMPGGSFVVNYPEDLDVERVGDS